MKDLETEMVVLRYEMKEYEKMMDNATNLEFRQWIDQNRLATSTRLIAIGKAWIEIANTKIKTPESVL